MKIALCQTTVHKDWHKNLRNAERVIADAVKSKADMVVLPEMFICPYNKKAISAAAPAGRRGSMAGDVRGGSKESCLSCGGKYTGERGWAYLQYSLYF